MPQTYENWDDSPQGSGQDSPGRLFGQAPTPPQSTQQQAQQVPGQVQQQGAQAQPQQQQAQAQVQAQQLQQQARVQQPQQQVQQPQQAQPQPQQSAGQQHARTQASPGVNPGYQPPSANLGGAPQIAYVPVQQVPQKKGHGWIVALVLIVCMFAFTAFCVKSCTDVMVGSGMGGAVSGPSPNSVAVIDIDGTIQYDGTACSPDGLKSLLDQAEGNDDIKAVVLRVNSGGGTATAGEEMAEYVRDFKKPVVVSSASLNASAAYEISSQANYIYVAKTTEIGSIGTALEVTDLSGLLDMLGVDIEVITSSDSKDSTYGYRPLSDEERTYYQGMVDQINDIFIENVATGRSMEVDAVRALATGLVFTGIDAVGNGLADEVGTLEDAIAKAAELAGVSDYTRYDLALGSYDISSLYYLLGGSDQDSSQRALPNLKQ